MKVRKGCILRYLQCIDITAARLAYLVRESTGLPNGMAEIRTRRILREKADCKQSHPFGSYVFCSILPTRY